MWKYTVKRILMTIPTLIGAGILVFFLMRLIPGDICALRLAGGGNFYDPEAIRICHERLGLDQPAIIQFVSWIWNFFQFDFGISMWTGRPIVHEIAIRFQLSLQIAIMTTIVSVAIALPLGIISAIKQDTWIDYAVRVLSIGGIAIPSFWLGIMLLLGILIVTQAWFGAPWLPPITYVPIWEEPLTNLSMVIWPALATGYRYSAVATRMTRSSMLEVLREDYVRTARAKGLVENLIINRHALRNALLPVITVIGVEFAFLMGGLVVTEQVFNLNGLGKLMVQSVIYHDYTMIQALVMLFVTIFVLVNFFVDICYAWLDPRIRYS